MPFFKRTPKSTSNENAKQNSPKSPFFGQRRSRSPFLTGTLKKHSSQTSLSSQSSGQGIGNEFPEGDIGIPDSILGTNKEKRASDTTATLLIDYELGDLGQIGSNPAVERKSRLSKSFMEVLSDKNALCYFVQFMQTSNAAHLIQFWLDAEGFQAATCLRMREHSLDTLAKTTLGQRSLIGKSDESDNIQNSSTGCHSNNVDAVFTNGSQSDTDGRVLECSLSEASESAAERLKKCIDEDAVKIYSTYLSQDAACAVGISDELRNETIAKVCRDDGKIDPYCFVAAQEYVIGIMASRHFPKFQISVYHCKHQIDVLTSGSVTLADLLYNDVALFYFMEFIEQEDGMVLLEFWMAIDNFHRHLQEHENIDSAQAQNDAMVLYDKYFSLQATTPLGFSQKVRFEIESNICRESGPLPNCFDTPLRIVLHTLEQMYLPLFLQSEIYYRYLSEIISTIQLSSAKEANVQHKRTDSEASSEISANSEIQTTKNTLLAMGKLHKDQEAVRKVMQTLEGDFHIDPTLLNPDNLYKRRNAGQLAVGYIDGFGRYKTDFEPEPDYKEKSSTKITKAVKKFITNVEDQEKEDMALKIAQMIVNDITSVTLGKTLQPVPDLQHENSTLASDDSDIVSQQKLT